MTIESVNRGGRPQALSSPVCEELLIYLDERPTAYLDEMRWFLFDSFNILVDESTISRALKRLCWNRKKCRRVAAQRNQDLCNYWMQRLAGWKAEQLVFLDESATCERTGELSGQLLRKS